MDRRTANEGSQNDLRVTFTSCDNPLVMRSAMTQSASVQIFSTKRLLLCSRENAARVAAQIFDQNRRACVVRTGHPLQPYRAVEVPTRSDEVEMVLCA